MFSGMLKAVVVLGLALGLSAKPQILPSVARYQGDQVVQVLGADTEAKIALVEETVEEVFQRSFRAGGLTARVNGDEVKQLEKLGFEVKLMVVDLAEHLSVVMTETDTVPEYRAADDADPDVYYARYHPYMKIFEYLDSLAATTVTNGVEQSWLVKKKIGSTLEKRPMWAFELGNPNATDIVYMEANIHACEWVATTSAQYVLREWINLYAGGTEAELFENILFVFVPLLNVDGYRYTYLTDRLWRKNMAINTNESCRGVDLNRNYNGFNGWKPETDQCARFYTGPEPYSEPETQVMVKYLDELKSNHRLVAMLDMHSYAQYLLYPYGYDFDLPDAPNKAEHVECGNLMAAAMKEVAGFEYVVMNAADWYPGYGCADDYWYDQVARGPWTNDTGLVYTIEMRPLEDDPIGFVLPVDEILPAAKELYEGYKVVVEYVRKALNV